MDVREKLLDLLLKEDYLCKPSECKYCLSKGSCNYYRAADRLIANGVTVQEDCKDCAEATQNCIVKLQEQIAELRSAQEWVTVKDRLPEESGVYIVTANDGHAQRVSFVQWQKKNRMWNLTGARSYWRVTHWMLLPKPPKETNDEQN